MLELRWRCDGHCGWGDCDPLEDRELMVEELDDSEDDSDHYYWCDSDGEQWISHRVYSGESG